MATSNDTTYSIYRIVCFVTGMVYVGQTVSTDTRIAYHFRLLRRNKHFNPHLQSAYTKYGRDNFFFDTLESGIPEHLINEREIYWIKYFDCQHKGYNLLPGGQAGSTEAKKKPCTWNNTNYPSQRACARELGINQSVLNKWLKQGYTRDSDVRPKEKPCMWNGIAYKNQAECARALGVSVTTMSKRLIDGFTCDADLPNVGKPCIWNGKNYLSVADCAAANHIPFQTMQWRVKHGCVSDSEVPIRKYSCIWNGVEYASQRALARFLCVDHTTVMDWIRKGFTCDADLKK